MDGSMAMARLTAGGVLEARAAGVALDLPGGWLPAGSLSDRELSDALGGDAAAALRVLAGEFGRSDGLALDFSPVLAAVADQGDATAPVPVRGIVVDVEEPMASTAARHTADQIGGVYTRLDVEDAEWAAEIVSPSKWGPDDMGMAMYLVGYEDRTILAVATATKDLFDTGLFRSIMRTMRTTGSAVACAAAG